MKKAQCFITKKTLPLKDLVKGSDIREQVFNLIQQDHPDFTEDSYISLVELNKYRKKYLEKILSAESKDISSLEKDVIKKISENKILSENIEPELDESLTLGQKIADKVAAFGGSWTFIFTFTAFLILWMGVNVWYLSHPFDPYPFILLNLFLSTLAAIQAPIIMMSQNRQEEKDRIRGEHDFQVNLKSELEIQILNEKIDHLINHKEVDNETNI
jgi:uncharacterized membrane protein